MNPETIAAGLTEAEREAQLSRQKAWDLRLRRAGKMGGKSSP